MWAFGLRCSRRILAVGEVTRVGLCRRWRSAKTLHLYVFGGPLWKFTLSEDSEVTQVEAGAESPNEGILGGLRRGIDQGGVHSFHSQPY